MGYGSGGLMDVKKSLQGSAKAGLREVAAGEQSRDLTNKTLEMEENNSKKSMISTGAGLGLAGGMASAAMGLKFGMMAGPVGMIGGAAIGYLISELF